MLSSQSKRLTDLWKWLREESSLESDCAATRDRERHRRALLASLSGAFNKAVSLASSLISVPLTIKYLDRERYGIWLALSSALAFLTFADFGMGNGLLNAVAHALGKQDLSEMKKSIASSFFSLAALCGVFLLCVPVVVPFLPLGYLLGTHTASVLKEAYPAAAVLLSCFALNLPLDVVQRVQTGLQMTFQSNLWRCFGSLLGLCALLLVVHLRLGLPALILAAVGSPLLATIANFYFFFWVERPDLIPRLADYGRRAALSMSTQGLKFVLAQLGASVLTAAPILATAQLIGAGSAATTGVVQRMFLTPYSLCEFLWSPLWPAYGEAWTRRDYRFIRNTFRRTTPIIAVSMLLMVTIGTLASGLILRVWTRGGISASMPLVAAIGALMLVRVFRGSLSVVVNGCGFLTRSAVLFAITGCAVMILPKISLLHWSPERVIYFILALELIVVLGMSIDVHAILSTRGDRVFDVAKKAA